jgi:hypothetical protein
MKNVHFKKMFNSGKCLVLKKYNYEKVEFPKYLDFKNIEL